MDRREDREAKLYNDLSLQHSQLGGHQSRPVRGNTSGQGRGEG